MTKEELLARLSALKPELERLGIKRIAVFGSVARGEGGPASDLDLLVEFYDTPGIFEFIGVKERLEELLGRRVDLATEGALHHRLRDRILKEAVYAA
ncbi:MAG: nucleotidyltransferase family protein [Pseudomonadota bacterium]